MINPIKYPSLARFVEFKEVEERVEKMMDRPRMSYDEIMAWVEEERKNREKELVSRTSTKILV